MFFFCLGLFSVCGWYLPWWSLALAALAAGFLMPGGWFRAMQAALAAALSWGAIAFIHDGQSYGLISQRMSGLFHLPSPGCLFLVMAFIGGMTAFLSYKSGAYFRSAPPGTEWTDEINYKVP